MELLIGLGIGGASLAAAIGSYFWTTTPEQRELYSIGATLYWNRLKHMLGPEEDPLIVSVEISLYYRSRQQNVATALGNATRGFIQFLRQNGPVLEDISFDTLIRSGHFSDVPSYSHLVNGEMVIRYRDPPGSDRIYAVVFSHNCPIRFPIYPLKATTRARLSFRKVIIQAYLGKEKTNPDPQSDVNVTDIVLEFAGPKCDFYHGTHVLPLNFRRMFWEVLDPQLEFLKLIDSYGTHYIYDLEQDAIIDWPHDSFSHIVWVVKNNVAPMDKSLPHGNTRDISFDATTIGSTDVHERIDCRVDSRVKGNESFIERDQGD